MLYGKKINAVPRTKTPEQALAALMRLCARAERSEEDARRLMTRWGVAPADRERVLERLRRDRFIDDARYAEAFVREKINLSGWGARKIADALHRKRIARETIERALAALDAGTARERLADLLRRKVRTTRAATPYELKNKLIRYGLAQGYDYEAVRDAADALIATTDDSCDTVFYRCCFRAGFWPPPRRNLDPNVTASPSATWRGSTRPTSARCAPTISIRAWTSRPTA